LAIATNIPVRLVNGFVIKLIRHQNFR